MHSEEVAPFWGFPDANVNWCEEDYVVTRYIAEFWNTVTSLIIVLVGLHGVYVYRHRQLEQRHSVIFYMTSVVGMGSALFHCTLRKTGQMLDEVPMVWGNHALLYSSMLIRHKGSSPLVLWGLVLSAVLLTVIYVYFQYFITFSIMYGLTLTYQAKLVAGWISEGFARNIYTPTWLCIYLSAGLYFGGLALWCIENLFCNRVQTLNLHAIWHIGAGMGTYYLNLLLMIQRLHFKSRRLQLVSTPLFKIPHILVIS